MKFILLVFLLGFQGQAETNAFVFDTEAECESAEAEIPGRIADYNFKMNEKIEAFSTTCAPLEKAPQGKDA